MRPHALNILTLLWSLFFGALIVGIVAQIWWTRRKKRRNARGFPVDPRTSPK